MREFNAFNAFNQIRISSPWLSNANGKSPFDGHYLQTKTNDNLAKARLFEL